MFIDSDNLESISNKLDMRILEEKEIYSKYNDCFNYINKTYKSKQSKLDIVESELLLSINKMITNHENNVFLIKKRIEVIRDVKRQIKELDDSVSLGRIV